MDESTNPAQSSPKVPPPVNSLDSRVAIRQSRDWLMLGFLVLVVALAFLVALMILIAFENGPSI